MYEYKIKEVVKIVDGDTIDVSIDLGFNLTKKERVRVAGIDTPESRTSDDEEKVFGLEAKEHLKHKLENAKTLTISTEKDGKYGRMLGWIYADGSPVSINQLMIDQGYAWAYDGGTKEKNYEELLGKRYDGKEVL
jgi:micrococcal nuclease|tara:strand:- start:320 stop:724 length:405 start_codon:yes stop_codon:yes gene_type:complete